ncbi:MAG: winged helix-turn-helix domain-containing protein [Chloroflexota bacterium]|nr:winged helix-turn-helix domain-containing protein [Chloroflexota bacterium]
MVDAHIRQPRRKLDDPVPSWLIQTIRGVGYHLAAIPDSNPNQ